jgi:hypothetical protein
MNLYQKRLENEFRNLLDTPLKGFVIESHDILNKCLKIVIKNRRFQFDFLENYPFQPPVVSNEMGLVIHVKEQSVYSIREIMNELYIQESNLSSVFEHEDDPDVVEIMRRQQEEAEKLVKRAKLKRKCLNVHSLVKMAEFRRQPKTKKMRSERETVPAAFVEQLSEEEEYLPSVDELLQVPEKLSDGQTMDQVLDNLDIEIAERRKKHEEEMANVDIDIAAEKRRQEERRERVKENALLRDRLEVEITESVLRRMFRENKEYLQNIKAGKVESTRHNAFHKSSKTRHALYYTMITDPFTDDQLDWTLEEIGKVWMKTKREQMNNNEYVWKVLLAECFIKLYMDHFGCDKKEAEKRISETPLHKSKDSEEENTSDD